LRRKRNARKPLGEQLETPVGAAIDNKNDFHFLRHAPVQPGESRQQPIETLFVLINRNDQ
jgi:hypothetical protein